MQLNPLWLFTFALSIILISPFPASAYYNPSTGRWLNRDPLTDEAFCKLPFCKQPRLARAALGQSSPFQLAGNKSSSAALAIAREAANPHLFVGNAALSSIDILGLKPCADCSASDIQRLGVSMGMQHIYPSIEERREYGGWVCCPTNRCNTGPPKPTPSPVVTGNVGPPWEINLANSKCPNGSTPVADWHTHPDGSTQTGNPGEDSPDRRGVMHNAARLECDFVGFMTNARLTTSMMDGQGVETVIASGP
jgi:hypothetical protein